MRPSQADKARRFRGLHEGPRAWPRDGRVSRDEALAHARAIVMATDLPVAGDLEKGFGYLERSLATPELNRFMED